MQIIYKAGKYSRKRIRKTHVLDGEAIIPEIQLQRCPVPEELATERQKLVMLEIASLPDPEANLYRLAYWYYMIQSEPRGGLLHENQSWCWFIDES